MQRGLFIDFDLENSPLEIKTDSTLGSDELVRVYFYTSQGHNAGAIEIYFRPSPLYHLEHCHESWTSFLTDLPTDNDKVWKITLSRTSGIRLVIQCNDKEVVNILISDSVCSDDQWKNYWSKETKKIKFLSSIDTASDFYRQSFSPGKKTIFLSSTYFNSDTPTANYRRPNAQLYKHASDG